LRDGFAAPRLFFAGVRRFGRERAGFSSSSGFGAYIRPAAMASDTVGDSPGKGIGVMFRAEPVFARAMETSSGWIDIRVAPGSSQSFRTKANGPARGPSAFLFGIQGRISVSSGAEALSAATIW
jgi:hypothetical protein